MLALQARVALGAKAMNRYSPFPKAQNYWSLTIRLFHVISRTLAADEGSYYSAEMQSVYSTAPADWAHGDPGLVNEATCISHSTSTLEKGMHPTILSLAMGK